MPLPKRYAQMARQPDLVSIEDTSTLALVCLALDPGRALSALGVGQ